VFTGAKPWWGSGGKPPEADRNCENNAQIIGLVSGIVKFLDFSLTLSVFPDFP